LMQVYEFSKIDASIVIMIMAIGFSLGATFWGLVSDRLVVSRKRVFLIGLVLYNLAWFLFTSVTTETMRSFLPLLLLGFFFGVMPISIVMVKELFPKRMMGAVTGSANAYPFVGAAFYQILIGYFLDTHGLVNIVEGVRVFSKASYRLSFTVCLATLIAATAMAFLIREHLESREERH
jgi:sugar phosphate permease